MMTTLFYLILAVILIGLAIYIYTYLAQQQNKFIPKNKYDEVWDEVFTNKPRRRGSFTRRVNVPNPLCIGIGLGILSCITLYFFSIRFFTQFSTNLNGIDWIGFVYLSFVLLFGTPLFFTIVVTAIILGSLIIIMMKTMR